MVMKNNVSGGIIVMIYYDVSERQYGYYVSCLCILGYTI